MTEGTSPRRPDGGPVPDRGEADKAAGKSKVEIIKEQSRGLRGDLAAQLASEEPSFDQTGYQLLKFHGTYQQDDRDQRGRRDGEGGRRHIFMVRARIPAGRLAPEQYLALEALADRHANGTLRLTTRQAVQLHGVLKTDLKATIRAINEAMLTTLAACGDVNRNVMGCPAPEHDRCAQIAEICEQIASRLSPKTRAYHEIWLDGEKVVGAEEEEDPIYGKAYLPRKFKIGVAFPQDNCVDVFTQDIGVVPVLSDGAISGYNLIVGGGLGMTHRKPETFPRLGDRLGFVAADLLIPAIEAIVSLQRDHGNRENRRLARMKYVVEAWGVDRFRAEVERRLGAALEPWVDVGDFHVDDHLGWREQGDGKLYLGLPIENGRIQDNGRIRLKSGLHAVIERFQPQIRLTPHQNLLLTDIDPAQRDEIESLLDAYGVATVERTSQARRHAMACPALPTCGLAITEAERVMPSVIDEIERVLEQLGLEKEPISIRMTGCPNGCARPYTAELAFVGRSKDQYNVYVGGAFEGTRLASLLAELVHLAHLPKAAETLLSYWKAARRPGEPFGDFAWRKGIDDLKARLASAGLAPLAGVRAERGAS